MFEFKTQIKNLKHLKCNTHMTLKQHMEMMII